MITANLTTKPAARPDAAMYPVGWRPRGSTQGRNIDAQLDFLEPLLGGKGWIRHVKGPGSGMLFVTTTSHYPNGENGGHDTVYFHDGHYLAGQPRYDWYQDPAGCLLGYLKAEAKPATTTTAPPAPGSPSVAVTPTQPTVSHVTSDAATRAARLAVLDAADPATLTPAELAEKAELHALAAG